MPVLPLMRQQKYHLDQRIRDWNFVHQKNCAELFVSTRPHGEQTIVFCGVFGLQVMH